MSPRNKGITFVLMAITIFAIQDGISKHLGALYPPIFVAMIRCWAFATFVLILARKSSGGFAGVAASRKPFLQVARGVLLAAQIVVAITSFATVGLAQAQAIFQSTPLLVTLLSVPLLGEQVGWRRWLAITAGFIGVLLIINPGTGAFDAGVMLPLSGSLMFALYAIATRLVSRADTAMTSFFYTGIAGAVAMTIIGTFYWTTLAPFDWVWMTVLCTTGIAGHYCLIRAYDLMDAVTVQPLMYIQLVFACIMGVALFDETLSLHMIAGSCIVVGAGLFTVWREHVLAKKRKAMARP